MPEADAPVAPLRRRWRSRRYTVVDDSMRPSLEPGDRLLVDPVPVRAGLPPVGAIVVLRDPEMPTRALVKRVAARDAGTDRVTVLGDAGGASRDSRSFGDIPRADLIGIAWFRYLPGPRRGSLGAIAPAETPKP
jgi:nickel-type superoxide dismutase maturation protease